MLYLASDNSSMWTLGNIFGALFFLVIIILALVVYKMVTGGSGSSVSQDDHE